MEIRRVALIYDDRPRPETTGVYCRRALADLASVTHLLPEALDTVSNNDFDLFLSIDDGLTYRVPERLHPSAWWAIDTHVDFERCLNRAQGADLVFAAQRSGADRLRDAGIASASWLPLACDPTVHRPHPTAKQFDVCFVGNVFAGPRQELLDAIQRDFASTFVGQRYFDDMARMYSASRIVFNRSVAADVNMRVFEALACGAFLLTNDLPDSGQDELFRNGVHFCTYGDLEELLERLECYLKREDERQRIATAGLAEVLAKHTYAHRMRHILHAAEQIAAKSAVSRPAPATNGSPRKSSTPDLAYYDFERPELLALVPPTACRVLEIGCGTGRLGTAIKNRQPAHVTGIELCERAAEIAATRLDRVISADVEAAEFEFPVGSFECVVCGDVLEHLRSPDLLLQRAREWLTDDGMVVASVPNVRHHTVVSSLLAGNWTYESAGLLDKTHLRFFTRREIEKLFARSGFTIGRIQAVPGSGYQQWVEAGRPGEVRAGQLFIDGLSSEDAEEFFTYQWLVTATPARPRHGMSRTSDGVTSIVIVTWNEFAYTRLCIDSIRLLTDEPYELIVVDNGSTDGTLEYLRGCQDVRLIENGSNRGFPAAANQGIRASTGPQVLLINNDTVCTTGWLRRQLDALYREPMIGLVGPCSNNVSGDQQIPVNYSDLSLLDGFAWDWAKANCAKHEETDRLVGFCLLIRREVIDQIGLLDERFGVGNFEDDDFCRRARAAGFRLVIARDAFVHHFGSRTFLGSGTDLGSLLHQNERLYREKWDPQPEEGLPTLPVIAAASATADPPVGPARSFSIDFDESGALRLVPTRPRLSLAMIVRDNAGTIEAALSSIRPWVDDMVVVDTGSTDETPDICRRLGARVFHFPWCDSFAIARNESLKHARGEWVFWMDSDDVIDADNGRKLRDLVRQPHPPDLLGFIMKVLCPGAGPNGHHEMTVVDHCKVIRNRPDLRFENRIHEQVLGAIRAADGEVAFTDLFVVHAGADRTPEGQQRKLERDLKLLELERQEKPNHPFVLFNLGMTYADAERYDEAIEMLRRSIAVAAPGESHIRKAYALLVCSFTQSGRFDQAWGACQEGRRLFPRDPELLFREGVLAHHFGRLSESERAYLGALANDDEPHFSSVDPGIVGFKARHNLALVYADMGRHDLSEQQWRLAVAELPDYRDGWAGLADCLISQRRLDAMEDLTRRLCADRQMRSIGVLLSARLAEAQTRIDQARSTLEAGLHEFPEEVELLRELCRLLFYHGSHDETVLALKNLSRVEPTDAATQHNLAQVFMRMGRYNEAIQACHESLRHRPDSPQTQGMLNAALTAISHPSGS